MYLKRLEIQGFKSFANKIEMQFDNGIIGVVGPNGSGKSNISDSIRWVLGEQSPKSLRGSKMEDVIFAGTTTRKPVGMAEVSLTLDNTSMLMPIDYGEVTITRRVYRSGESEYYLNKSSCRLKDIRELLMDTGIGKEGYSIIGQGKIDEILSSKPEERRLIFEEAAGIIKYKTRRDEAEKKLNATRENLLRVADILHELENQLEPLKNQSKKALKYQGIKEKLLRLEVNLFIREIDKTEAGLKELIDQIDLLKNSMENQKEEKQKLNQQIEDVNQLLNQWDESFSNLQNKFFNTENEIKKKEGAIQLSKEKTLHNDENLERVKEEILKLKEEEINANSQLEIKLIELEEVCKELDQLQKKVIDKVESYERQAHHNSSREKDMEDSKSYIIDALNEISDKKSELNSLKTLIRTMEERLHQINKELCDFNEKLKEKNTEVTSLEENLKLLVHSIDSIEEEAKEIKGLEEKLDNNITTDSQQLEVLKNQINHRQSRRNVLEEMEKDHEGFNKSVKNILQACEKNPTLGKGIYGVVADLLKVPKGYEVAIETALGVAIQNIVSETEADAKRLIEHMKRNNLGRITILPLSAIQSRNINNEEHRIIGEQKNVEIALDIISCDEKYKNIFSNLLARVLIVPNIDVGIAVAKKLQYKLKIVTIDGDVINIGGSLTGGSSIKNTAGILGRKRELEDLVSQIHTLELRMDNQKNKLDNMVSKKKEYTQVLLNLNNTLQKNKIKEATLLNKIEQAKKEEIQYRASILQIEGEIKQLNNVNEDSNKKQLIIDEEILKIEDHISDTRQTVNEIHRNLQLEKEKQEALNIEITQSKVKEAEVEGQKRALLQEIDHLQATIEKAEKLKILKQNEVANINSKYSHLEEEINQTQSELTLLREEGKNLELKLEELKIKKSEILKEEENIKRRLEANQQVTADIQENGHKLDLKKTKLEMQQQSYYNKLWEEYELTYNSAQEMKQEIEDIGKATREIKEYKDEIRALGNINLESIDEYERVKERYDFLKKQKDDLYQAQESLKDVIDEMEKNMEIQFINQFQIIRENFNNVFIKLFGGGKADLILEDEANILKSGVDIIAQPPGKKLQNLSLLSGGERALTAISLLFAILLVKPSPFCILDEIEAALDDANVQRFSSFLKELSETTQFIIVTHRKGTMEITDALYGVTMEEEGVSSLVSVKLADKNDDIAS
ncbi:chromosome segregation protein SMC [Alkaliphilus peptidifermentans]|uniref:Chromosome partition protein Smc n=1 Tax=Alkaliphilus peptidifermentans DSM 18978 TaxID=1120976 RepID=A0A1G5J9B5_9FIRM|nr:chromosome segregation protein SMC [Alkaliphilus peptidifermentans]SCY84817.1 condensin subunit Smc [Alkaliphilus peptidifermentans DSM 18978]